MADTITIEVRMQGTGAATSEVRAFRGELNEVDKAARRVGSGAGVGASGLARLDAARARLHSGLRSLDQKLSSTSQWLGSKLASAAKIGAVGLVGLIGTIATFGLKSASNFQQSRIAFETLLGSVSKGDALFKQLQAINLKTPFQLNEIAPATQLLLRYGVAADQVVPVLKSLLDAAALTNDPQGNLQALALATGQIVSTGHLMGQDARQLTQAGIPAYELFAQKLGITTAAAQKLGEAGKLSSDVFLEGLINLEGPLAKLRGGAEKMAGTLSGQLSNLKDAINVGLADAAAPLTEQVTKLIPSLTKTFASGVAQVGPPVFRLIGLLFTALDKAIPILAPLLAVVVTQLGRLLRAAGPSLEALAPLGGRIGQSLIDLVDALVPTMPDLITLFVALVALLPDFIQLLAAVAPLVGPLARLATTLLDFGPTRILVEGLLVALLGYRALRGIVGTLAAFADGLRLIGVQTEFLARAQAGAAGAKGAGAAGAAGAAAGGAGVTTAIGGAAAVVVGLADLNAIKNIGTGINKHGVHLTNPFAKHKGDKSNAELAGSLFFGDVSGNLAASSRIHAAAAGRTSGRASVTSTVRSFGLAGPGSGHRSGKAWDVAADYPHAYANNIRALGGFASVHDQGSGRHVHAQIGDTVPPPRGGVATAGGGDVIHVDVLIERAYGQIDFERGVANGVAKAKRAAISRGHKDESRFDR